ncbi:MAG: DUF3307 domain-containing protein [Candidatus Peregrinibacteria bacterium]
MNLILSLVTAHFLADFAFQPQWLANAKKNRWWGVPLHALIHFIAMAVLLIPFLNWPSVWGAMALVALTHWGIDYGKIVLGERSPMHPLLMYLADQLLHFIILLIASTYFFNSLVAELDYSPHWFFTDPSIFSYLFLLTLATYALDMTRWTYRISQNPDTPSYRRDYKTIVRNGLIVTVSFVLYWVLR